MIVYDRSANRIAAFAVLKQNSSNILVLRRTALGTSRNLERQFQVGTILRWKKRWRLIHFPINVSARNLNIFETSLHCIVSTGRNKIIAKMWLSLPYFVGCVRFAWYYGKTLGRHLVSYGEIHVP